MRVGPAPLLPADNRRHAGYPSVPRPDFEAARARVPLPWWPLRICAFSSAAAEEPLRWRPDPLAEASVIHWKAQRRGRGESRYYPCGSIRGRGASDGRAGPAAG